ncbi:MAG: FapA family protein [Desulfobacterales bacterium]|nr:FapA family protein [Desulfobacterales bacterium]
MTDSTPALADAIQTILSEMGYDLSLFESADQAVVDLKKSQNAPYALIITGYELSDIKGEEFLKQARQICPDTQRMLMAEASQIQALVDAINQAGIHACLTLPVNNDDLLNQVSLCCGRYDDNLKQKNLKRITTRQNRQLFQIANNFKKKEALNLKHLAAKDKEIRILESRIRSAGGSVHPPAPLTLSALFQKKGWPVSETTLADQFVRVKDKVKQILESAVTHHNIGLTPLSYTDAAALSPDSGSPGSLGKQAIPLVFEWINAGNLPHMDSASPTREIILDDHFELTIPTGKTQALIKIKTDDTQDLTLAHVKQFLEKNKVINGVKNDDAITRWLQTAVSSDDPFLIAMGKDPEYSKDARIIYHFPTDYLHAGKINKDGSINFQDRGDIPYVEEDAFLASKQSAAPGKPGIDVHGQEIEVDTPQDLTFSAGPGARISEDGQRIYATACGQPHLDAMGNISVCPEYQLQGDIGFETGDVNFDGNVVVSGKVKQGFKVTCASLTAKEIQGAEVDITGDLNVSLGIVDTELVKVKGSVQAKFIRNSRINAFGDLIIQKEIVDSTIYLSGACMNESGSIINSQISAKMGIRAGRIGNRSSKPARLTVGVDEHIRLLVAKVDAKLNTNTKVFNELNKEIQTLEKEDHDLHAKIARHAHVQDRSQLELKDIKKKMDGLKASGNMSAYQKVSRTVKEIKRKAAEAEELINEGFDRQDEIETQISQKQSRIKELEEENQALGDEKKRLLEFSGKQAPLPEVRVAGNAASGTRIFSENASLTLHRTTPRCRIRESSNHPERGGRIQSYEIKIDTF